MRSLSKIHFVIIILFFSFFLISCMKYRKENSDLNSIENLYITAKYYMNSGDYDSAIKVLYRIFEVEGEMPFLMNEFAMAFKGKGKFEKAIDYLDIAIAADSLNHIYFNNRGNIYITIGLLSKAEDDFIQSMKLNNSYSPAFNSLGYLNFLRGNYIESVNYYSLAIEYDDNYDIAYSNRAISYYELGQYPLALVDIDKAIAINPKFSKAYINRGIIKYKIDDIKGACEDWLKAERFGEAEGRRLYSNYCCN